MTKYNTSTKKQLVELVKMKNYSIGYAAKKLGVSRALAGRWIQMYEHLGYVATDAKDWANLNVANSKTFIALGIKVKDALGWNAGYDTNTHYAVKEDTTLFGSLPSNTTGTMTLEG